MDASARKERRDKSAAKKMKQLLNDRTKKLLKEQKMKEIKERRDNENAAKALRKEARAAGAAKKRAEKSTRVGKKGRKGRRGGVAKILPEGWSMIINVRKSGKYFKRKRAKESEESEHREWSTVVSIFITPLCTVSFDFYYFSLLQTCFIVVASFSLI